MNRHDLGPATSRPLHPTEARLLTAALDKGVYVRRCTCGQLLFGATVEAVDEAWRDHLRHIIATTARDWS